MSEKIKPAEGGKVKRKLWSKENGITQDQVNSTMIFIDELRKKFDEHEIEFIYPNLNFQNNKNGIIQLKWDITNNWKKEDKHWNDNDKLYMNMTIDYNKGEVFVYANASNLKKLYLSMFNNRYVNYFPIDQIDESLFKWFDELINERKVTYDYNEIETLWSSSGKDITKEHFDDVINFIKELKSLFEKHGIEFAYPELYPSGKSINVFWDKGNNETFMEMWIEPNNEPILVNIGLSFFNNYHEFIDRNNIPNSLFEFLKKDSEKKSGYFKLLSN